MPELFSLTYVVLAKEVAMVLPDVGRVQFLPATTPAALLSAS